MENIKNGKMNFEDLLLESQRVSSKRNKIATIVDPVKLDEFFLRLLDSVDQKKIDLEVACAVSLGISAGLRVSECLLLKTNQVNLDTGAIQGIRVLKKRDESGFTKRMGMLHPIGLVIVNKFITEAKKRPHEFLIKLSRQQLDRAVKFYFSESTDWHALCRHTHVSVCLHRGMSAEKTAKLLAFSNLNVMFAYVHTNTSRDLEDLYKKAA